MQDHRQFVDLAIFFFVGFVFQPSDDVSDDLFEMNRAASIDGLHQSTDIWNVPRFSGRIILEVKNFQARDHALAVIKKFQHFIDLQIGQVQCHPVS